MCNVVDKRNINPGLKKHVLKESLVQHFIVSDYNPDSFRYVILGKSRKKTKAAIGCVQDPITKEGILDL